MNREEFLAKRDALNKALKEAEREYIAECCPFAVGDVIEIDGVQGEIESLGVKYSGSFRCIWRRMKKKGGYFADTTEAPFGWMTKAKLIKSGAIC